MRRKDREQDQAFALKVIDESEFGVLCMDTSRNVPYGVPLSIARMGEDAVVFHCALAGEKLEYLRENPQVCVAFVSFVEAIEDDFSTQYASALVFGRAQEIVEPEEKIQALRIICEKFIPKNMPNFEEYAARFLSKTGVWKVPIEQISAKALLK